MNYILLPFHYNNAVVLKKRFASIKSQCMWIMQVANQLPKLPNGISAGLRNH